MPDPITESAVKDVFLPDDDELFDDDDDYDPDSLDDALAECGLGPDGLCGMAGTEFCEFECPFRG